MTTKNAIIYVRASTKTQETSIPLQTRICNKFAADNGYTIINTYSETASGGDNDRVMFNNAVNDCLDNDYYFISAKVDRVARKISAIGEIIDSGLKLRIVQLGNNDVNKMVLAVFAAMAETERDFIKMRTREALQYKKSQGVVLGSPDIKKAQAASIKVRSALAASYNAATLKVIDEIKSAGILTYTGIASSLTRRGYKTRRGNNFTATSVRRIMLPA
jgi:DNA invertase Pin-like site-specific DNA recombinase